MTQQSDQRLNELKQKYQPALNVIQQTGVRLHNLHVQDNKLFIRGTAPSQEAKNRVWDQIKLIDPNYADLIADITVEASAEPQAAQTAGASASGSQGVRTYQVKPGDSLSRIAKEMYGNANMYMRIFEANRDKLSDPNKIQPGQQLVIP